MTRFLIILLTVIIASGCNSNVVRGEKCDLSVLLRRSGVTDIEDKIKINVEVIKIDKAGSLSTAVDSPKYEDVNMLIQQLYGVDLKRKLNTEKLSTGELMTVYASPYGAMQVIQDNTGRIDFVIIAGGKAKVVQPKGTHHLESDK